MDEHTPWSFAQLACGASKLHGEFNIYKFNYVVAVSQQPYFKP